MDDDWTLEDQRGQDWDIHNDHRPDEEPEDPEDEYEDPPDEPPDPTASTTPTPGAFHDHDSFQNPTER